MPHGMKCIQMWVCGQRAFDGGATVHSDLTWAADTWLVVGGTPLYLSILPGWVGLITPPTSMWGKLQVCNPLSLS